MSKLVQYKANPLAPRGRRAVGEVRQAQRPARRALVQVGAGKLVAEAALEGLEELVAEEARVCREQGAVADARARLLVDAWTTGAAVQVGLAMRGEQ